MGQDGVDTISGNSGDDYIWRSSRRYTFGDAGDDKLYGESDNDTIYGGDGTDTIDGGTGNDEIYGNISTNSADGSQILIDQVE